MIATLPHPWHPGETGAPPDQPCSRYVVVPTPGGECMCREVGK